MQYSLPKLSHPQYPLPPKPQDDLTKATAPAPGAERATSTTNAINIVLKSTRNPTMTLSLPSTAPSTTIARLKQQIHDYLGGPTVVSSVDKIKVLHNKKPVPASKQTVADLVDTTTKDLELGVMVMGGAPDPPAQKATAVEAGAGLNPADDTNRADGMEGIQTATAAGKLESPPVQPDTASGAAVLHSKEFWDDLEGFLAQRIRSQEDAARLKSVFEKAWRSSAAAP